MNQPVLDKTYSLSIWERRVAFGVLREIQQVQWCLENEARMNVETTVISRESCPESVMDTMPPGDGMTLKGVST